MSQHCWGNWSDAIHFVSRFKSPNYSFDIYFVDIEIWVLCIVRVIIKKYNMLKSLCYVFVCHTWHARSLTQHLLNERPQTCSPQLAPSTIAMQNASVRDVLRKIWPCTRTPRTSLCSKAPKRRTLGAKSEGTNYHSSMFEECLSANTP